MSDQDFNFAPPPPRRERKEFEPPPWEQHLFERLTEERTNESAETVPVEAGEPDLALKVPEVVAVTAVAEEQETPGPSSPEPEEDDSKKPLLDEVRLAAMMFELRAEEVPATQVFARATLVAGAMLLLIGVVMVIWSFVMIAVALRRPEQGRSGVYVGMTVLVFGAGFAGTGAWFVFKTLRQQGVL